MKRFVLLAMVIVMMSVTIPETSTKFSGEIMEIPRSTWINL